MTDKLEKLDKIISLLERDNPSVEEVVEVIEAVLAQIEVLKKETRVALAELESTTNDLGDSIKDEISEILTKIDSVETRFTDFKERVGVDYEKVLAYISEEIQLVRDSIPDLEMVNRKIAEVESKIPELPEELTSEKIRDKLEVLKDEERLDKSAIKGLKEELARIEGLIGSGGSSSRGGPPIGDRLLVVDFTNETDGSNKTFELPREPRKLNATKVWGTDFPFILRYNIDYTISGKILTLTSEVPAPSEGATLICEIVI